MSKIKKYEVDDDIYGPDSDGDMVPPGLLTERQMDLGEGYLDVVREFGPFDQTSGPDGSHYSTVSPFDSAGISCENCIFFDDDRTCDLVSGDIDPDGVCKFWVIPSVLMQDNDGDEAAEKGVMTSGSMPGPYAQIDGGSDMMAGGMTGEHARQMMRAAARARRQRKAKRRKAAETGDVFKGVFFPRLDFPDLI